VHSVVNPRKWITVIILGFFVGIAVLLFQATSAGFIPNEDGIIMSDLTMPQEQHSEQTKKTVIHDKFWQVCQSLETRIVVRIQFAQWR
jgi:multidrug efflux pump subunit AcrB